METDSSIQNNLIKNNNLKQNIIKINTLNFRKIFKINHLNKNQGLNQLKSLPERYNVINNFGEPLNLIFKNNAK